MSSRQRSQHEQIEEELLGPNEEFFYENLMKQ